MIDKDKFLFLYENEFTGLTPNQRSGLAYLVERFNADEAMQDPRWIAYCLATVKHETAGTFQPIAEYGKGTGRKYGVPDKITGQTYYGRGYVQLTWKENYQAMAQVTGDDLVNFPDLAMTPDVAYKIMSYGMRKGSFTGQKLSLYIHDNACNYVRARKIINGEDCAEKIAGYAVKLENIIIQSEVTA